MKASEIDWNKAPEGATHFGPENEEWIAAWYKLDEGEWFAMLTSDDDQWDYSPCVDDERVSQMIQRPAEWSGTGLPPVGTVCEGRSRKDKFGEVWGEVIVLAHRLRQAVVSFTDCERLQWCCEDDLRPIRTPEQIAAEEREKAIIYMVNCIRQASFIYDGRSQVIASALYDAGYRKVEGDKQ